MAKYKSNYSGTEIDQAIGKAYGDVGDAFFDSTTNQQYLFKTTEDKIAWLGGDTSVEFKTCPFEFTGTINRMGIVNLMDGKNLYYTEKSGAAVISVGFKSEEKGISDTSWSEVFEDAKITVEIDRGVTGKYETIVSEQYVLAGETFSFDVFKYLVTGNSRVRITAIGVDTESVANIVYSVLLTTMYLEPAGVKWNEPFIEGDTYELGGFFIGGALEKDLKIRFSSEKSDPIEVVEPLGTQTHTNIPYYFYGLEFPKEGTGVYTVEVWLDANGVESEHLIYNIMCVAEKDKNTAQLVAISNILPIVKNYGVNNLFSYAVYNGGSTTANPVVNIQAIVNNTPVAIKQDEVLNADATKINTYELEPKIETQESNIKLFSSIRLGDCLQEAVYQVDNSASHIPVGGAIFYLNPANRKNGDGNRDVIINESNLSDAKREYTAKWTNVTFTDGVNGWTEDNQGKKCLRLPAGSKVEIDYTPFVNAETRTIEFAYRVENVSDYNEDIISVASDLTSKFKGVRIKPKNILLHSEALNENDLLQGYNTKDEEFVHVLITVIKDYKKIGRLAQIYVNGVKKCSFEWSNSDTFEHTGKMVLGSDTADLYIYKARVYNDAFDWIMATQNRNSCLLDEKLKDEEREKMKSVLNDGNKIDFNQVKNNGFNYFTLRLPKGGSLPSYLSKTPVEGCRLEINIQQNPQFAINGIYENETTDGQGTTAMDYFRWNLRWKTDKIRITAKKNFASSMHSHKMGATALFNDLYKKVVGENEAGARVAVEQYGAYGFLEVLKEGSTDQYDYIPIGLYTIGQDKGDKATFGYNKEEYKDTLIHLEGSDHKPKAIGMDYPWDKLSVYTDSEGESGLGVKKEDGSAEKAWEIGACGKAKSDEEMLAYLTEEFKPAYDCDYRNTMMLVGVEAGTDIDSPEFRGLATSYGFTNADCLIWIDGEYETYYFDEIEKKYLKDGINILKDLDIKETDLKGATVADKNQEIIELRKARYRSEMEDCWHLKDSLFQYCILLLLGATDNFKKNSYPYKFGTLKSGSRWRWRQDDLDTLADINNQGLAKKIYSILNGDAELGNQLFNGNSSYHWTNIQFYYEDKIKDMMRDILTAMASLSDTGESLIEKAVGCIRKYFWKKAQDYFTKSAYNLDAEWTYEEAWAAVKNGTYIPKVDPLQQSLGDHYEAEREWFELRFIFIASMYGFGAFAIGNGKDTSLGQISFRLGKGASPFEFTPAIDMNPTILVGDSNSVNSNRRVKQGDVAPLPITTTESDTTIYIQAADYLSDIGDFSKVNLYPGNPELTIKAKRLQRLKVGDAEAENVTTILNSLKVLSCPSLMDVDARNVKALVGEVDLSQCPRLKSAMFGGSNVTGITLPKGARIETFELPGTVTKLSLVDLPNLTEEGLLAEELSKLTYLRVENCPNISAIGLLRKAFENNEELGNIRLVGFECEGTSADIDLLSELIKLNDNGEKIYKGIDADGSRNPNIFPVIEGVITINTPVYSDSIEALEKVYGTNLKINAVAGTYVRFEDEAFQELVADTYGDGTGVTQEQLDAVTNISKNWNSNTTVKSITDLYKFRNLKTINSLSIPSSTEIIYVPDSVKGTIPAFCYNTKLAELIIGNGATLLYMTLLSSAYITKFVIPDNVTTLGQQVFDEASRLKKLVYGENAKTLTGSNHYRGVSLDDLYVPSVNFLLTSNAILGKTAGTTVYVGKIDEIREDKGIYGSIITGYNWDKLEQEREEVTLPMVNEALNEVTEIKANTFRYMTQLEGELVIPDNITSIGDSGVYNCDGLTSVVIGDGVKSIGQDAFAYIQTLANLRLGNNIESIGDRAFIDCSNLTGELVIPNSVTSIGGQAFEGCTGLRSVTIGNSVTSLKKSVFYGCEALTSVVISNSVTSLGNAVFYGCKKLTNVTIPESVTTIEGRAFNLCRALQTIICRSITPPELGSDVFGNTNNSFSIYVPDEAVEGEFGYKNTNGWSAFADRIKPLSEYIES